MDKNYCFCDRVCTKSKKFKEDILLALGQKSFGGCKIEYNFLCIEENT